MVGQRVKQAAMLGMWLVMGAAPGLAQAVTGRDTGTIPAANDLPSRVGRIARQTGAVSLHVAGLDRWQAAMPNAAVPAGSAIQTEPRGSAMIDLGSLHVRLGSASELDLMRLDDRLSAIALPRGSACLDVSSLRPGESALVTTARGQGTLTKAGHYAVVAGDAEHPSVLTVAEGEAEFAVGASRVRAGPGQAMSVMGDGQGAPFQVSLAAATREGVPEVCLAGDGPASPRVVELPPVSSSNAISPLPDSGSPPPPQAEPAYAPYAAGYPGEGAPWGWTGFGGAGGFEPSYFGGWQQIGRLGFRPGGLRVAPGSVSYPFPTFGAFGPSFGGTGVLGAPGILVGPHAGFVAGALPVVIGPRGLAGRGGAFNAGLPVVSRSPVSAAQVGGLARPGLPLPGRRIGMNAPAGASPASYRSAVPRVAGPLGFAGRSMGGGGFGRR